MFVSGAEGLRFKSQASQIGRVSVANGLPQLRYFFKRRCVVQRSNDAEMGP